MELKVLKNQKDEIEIEIDNLTIAEVLRDYLNKDDSVELAAWKREHFQKPVILKVKTKGKTARKAVEDAISRINKEANKLVEEVKKAK